MRQNPWQVWHRCGVCGTIFSDVGELREHAAQHSGSKERTTHVDEREQTNPSAVPEHERRFDPNRKRTAGDKRWR